MATGCTPPKKKSPPPEKPKPINVVSENGDATWFGAASTHPRQWHVAWRKAVVSASEGAPTLGKMADVKGEIFQPKETKTFRSDQAIVQGSNVLTLAGNVQVYSPSRRATLKCDKLVYNANQKVFDAQGNVSVKGKDIDIAGIPEAMADADFKEISSPDLFSAPKEGHGPKAH